VGSDGSFVTRSFAESKSWHSANVSTPLVTVRANFHPWSATYTRSCLYCERESPRSFMFASGPRGSENQGTLWIIRRLRAHMFYPPLPVIP